ncbi:MAG TPA: M15 family metallopeptidase [Patescibacteria group bacterium]|nr:M15 family metallopeptidase [Patescibacteria group bacterium]
MYQAPRQPAYRYRTASRPNRALLYKTKRTAALIILVTLVVGVLLFAFFEHYNKDTASPASGSKTKQNATSQQPAQSQPAGFNKTAHSTTENSSLWVVVNKKHQLSPKDYKPDNLVVPNIPLRSNITSTEKYVRADMGKALESLVKDASNQGVHLNLQSGYRSYSFQVTLYNGYVAQQGQASADRQSARPGYSEHQTGLAADLGGTTQPSCNVAQCFSDTVEGKWLAANAYKYGFIIRYTTTDESVTGYEYEPWHVRYVGTDLSTEMHNQGVETLEEFFDIAGGTSY